MAGETSKDTMEFDRHACVLYIESQLTSALLAVDLQLNQIQKQKQKMDKEGEESEKNSPNSEKTVVVSPSMRGLTNEQLMQIADDPRAFNEFYKNAGQTGGATAAPSTSSKTSKTSSNSNNVLSPPSRLTVVSPEVHMREQEAQTAIHLRQYLQVGK